MDNDSTIILSIESAVRGGTISLLRDDAEIANWTGASGVSRAEDLLANIDRMLSENGISRHKIGLIAVSAGPGSFTGIRIGIATALGLKNGLGVEMSSVSALKAMVFKRLTGEQVTAALPVGRNAICLQPFGGTGREVVALDEPHTITESEFTAMVATRNDEIFVAHEAVCKLAGPSANLINFGSNLAYPVGLMCREHPGVQTQPLFISKSL